MCSISGFLGLKFNGLDGYADVNKLLYTFQKSIERGRDSFGVGWYSHGTYKEHKITHCYQEPRNASLLFVQANIVLANHRAEPTTEYVKEKMFSDVHPFHVPRYNLTMVHNGTIANDKELALEFGFPELIGHIDSYVLATIMGHICPNLEAALEFIIRNVKGSYAIALSDGQRLGLIANYKPLYLNFQPEGIYFSSLPEYVQFNYDFSPLDNIKKLPPYSYVILKDNENPYNVVSFQTPNKPKALVVCSGGLDSTVALTEAVQKWGATNVTLLHYLYHCNAESKEVLAVKNISKELGVELVMMPIDIFGQIITESPILRNDGVIQEYDKGVEFAYEWVPARNLVMMSLAVAYAEAKGFGYIYLGNNLEEASAYSDNEMEFMRKLQELLPNAVRDGYSLTLIQPVGNLMKHEIVKRGLEIGAPLDLTWSCYKAGERHCGVCGPCRMRKVAFEMLGQTEVIEYEQ
jgi:7-cyano-7-deazaguanine synthase